MRTIPVVFYAIAAIVLSELARMISTTVYYAGKGTLRASRRLQDAARALLAKGDRLRQ